LAHWTWLQQFLPTDAQGVASAGLTDLTETACELQLRSIEMEVEFSSSR
jgi:hypothetical protein